MADSKHSWIGDIKTHLTEAAQRAAEDLEQRLKAGKGPTNRILHQNDVLTGKWSPARALQTTLGGDGSALRPITQQDLEAFKRNIEAAKERGQYQPGITASEIINWSAKPFYGSIEQISDLQLAMREIHHCVPVSALNDGVKFLTNASPNSDVKRHNVFIRFIGLNQIVGRQEKSRDLALWVRKQPLLIDCDCGKQRYWYRYIATIGGFNSGRAETGFPKIRNPTLTNVACKHIVKTASEIKNRPSVLNFLVKMIDKSRAHDLALIEHELEQHEAERIISNQKRRKNNNIKTIQERKQAEQVIKIKKQLVIALKDTKPPKKVKPISRTNGKTAAAIEAELRRAMAQFGVTPTQEQIDQAIINAK